MITIEEKDKALSVSVIGEFTLSDFTEFEQRLQTKIIEQQSVSLILDLRDMTGFTLDVAWEEIKFSRRHIPQLVKIAIITDDQWLAWSAWFPRIFSEAELQVFEHYEDASEWV